MSSMKSSSVWRNSGAQAHQVRWNRPGDPDTHVPRNPVSMEEDGSAVGRAESSAAI